MQWFPPLQLSKDIYSIYECCFLIVSDRCVVFPCSESTSAAEAEADRGKLSATS